MHMPETEMRTSLCFTGTAGEVCYLRLPCLLLPLEQHSIARVVLLSAATLSVCLSGCVSVSTITPEPLDISSQNFGGIILGSNGRPKFENGYVVCDVLLYNGGRPLANDNERIDEYSNGYIAVHGW